MERTQRIARLMENYVFILNNHGYDETQMNDDELLALSKANLEIALRMKTGELDRQ